MAKIFLNGIDLNGKQAVNAADASAATDLVTLQQLQAYVRGLDWKPSVRAASQVNGALATAFENGDTVDGVVLATGDSILLMNQTTGSENGIYTVNASGAPTRRNDADVNAEVTSGMAVTVTEGTASGDKAYVLSTNDPIVVGTTALTFVPLGGGGSSYTAGNGLQLGGSQFSILLDTASGLVVSGTGIKIDTSVVVRKYAADCVVTTNPQIFTHNLASSDPHVMVKRASDGVLVQADVVVTDANNISVNFGGAPTAAQYRVSVKA